MGKKKKNMTHQKGKENDLPMKFSCFNLPMFLQYLSR